MNRVRVLLLALSVLSVPAVVCAQDTQTRTQEIQHSDGKSVSFHFRLREGDQVKLVIKGTATNCFEYNVDKVEIDDETSAQADRAIGKTEKTVTIVHEPRYGGYVVKVSRISRAGGCGTGDVGKLKDITIVIVAETEGVELEFAGGFTFADLTNPVFATRENDVGEQIVIQDSDAEDDIDLSVGAFMHVYGKNWRWGKLKPALTFGLGVGEESKATYYAGVSHRFGKQAYLTLGVIASSVDRLPAGVRVNDSLEDTNFLNNLGSKTETGLFLGLSYSFLGKKEAFEKPFKTGDDKGSKSASGTSQDSQTPAAPAQLQPCAVTTFKAELLHPSGDVIASGQLPFNGTIGCKPKAGEDQLKVEITPDGAAVLSTETVKVETDGTFKGATSVDVPAGRYSAKLTLVKTDGSAVGIPTTSSSFDVKAP